MEFHGHKKSGTVPVRVFLVRRPRLFQYFMSFDHHYHLLDEGFIFPTSGLWQGVFVVAQDLAFGSGVYGMSRVIFEEEVLV